MENICDISLNKNYNISGIHTNDILVGIFPFSFETSKLGVILNDMIKDAKTYRDLDAIGQTLEYARAVNPDMDIWEYQVKASKKMREIYNVLGEPVKGERVKMKRSELQ